jgi:hypothetical protein
MDLQTWHTENGRYLAASLDWLRLRLKWLARQNGAAYRETQPAVTPAAAPSSAITAERETMWRRVFNRSRPTIPTPGVPLLPDGSEARLQQQLDDAAQARDMAANMQPPPALLLLCEQMGLTAFERDILLLCAAMELDTRVPALCAQALGNTEQPHPTFALALSLFESPTWDALSPQRPLRFWRLVEVNPAGAQPLTATPLRADERIVNYIKGLNALDERLAALVGGADGVSRGELAPSQQAQVDAMLARWESTPAGEEPPVAVLLGTDPAAKLLVAQKVADTWKRQLCRIGLDTLPAQTSDVEWTARLWQRESALLPLALYVDTHVDSAAPDAFVTLDRFVSHAARSASVVMVASREPLPRVSFPAFSLDVDKPTVVEQRDAWMVALGGLDEAARHREANRLAGQYHLNLPEIRQVAHAVPAEPPDTLGARLWAACRDRARPRLGTLAQRIDPRATWDDLVLIDETTRLLRDIVAQVENRSTVYEDWGFAQKMTRGLGISALFAGESGTGKTMAAEVIANALDLALFRIDLSQVVSKYIGETEKNLQRVFDLMESGGAILFFDEADALFGKRSEVKDSHDRYANIEVNYLLQRMESFTGLAILATNMKSALDTAFMRRIRFIVPFNFPGPPERRVMWQKAFPQGVPREELDLERLARLNLTGANIHSIALNAAFLAARAGTPVTLALVLQAARGELRKLERPVNEAEFRV